MKQAVACMLDQTLPYWGITTNHDVIDWNACDTQIKLTSTETKFSKVLVSCMMPSWLNGGYSAECGGWALVDVQCLLLMLGGVRVGNSQRRVVSLPPHCSLGWGWGMIGVCSPVNYWGRCSQGCQRGRCTGLAPRCALRRAVGGVVWTNGGLKNNRWQMSASE